MTQHIQSAIARLLDGEAIPPNDPALNELLAEMRSAVRSPQAQRDLGLATVSLLSTHLRSVILAAKAMHTAKGASHG